MSMGFWRLINHSGLFKELSDIHRMFGATNTFQTFLSDAKDMQRAHFCTEQEGSPSAPQGYALDVDFGSMTAVSSASEYRFMLWDLRP